MSRLTSLCMVFISILVIAADGGGVGRKEIEKAYGPRRIALVIGIDDFRDPQWRPLHYAEKDAADMAEALGNPDLAHFDRVIRLTEPWETTLSSIKEALHQLDNENMSTEDLVFIYISTHGTLERDIQNQLRQYLVAYDTKFDDIRDTALDVQELVESFNELTSKRKVLIMASCHSGMGKSELPKDVEDELSRMKSGFFVKPVEFASEASVIIGVCSWGETAQEDPNLQNDIYTYFFLEGMKKYDRNQDGAISISEAHDYAQRKTYYYTDGNQRPFARSDILGTDPIILSGEVKDTGLPVVVSYSERLEGTSVIINGYSKGAFPDGFTTEPGWNRIEARIPMTDKRVYSGSIYVRKGERVDMDSLVEARSEPRLGLLANYRMMASEELSDDVLPGLPMYGLAYRINAFPVMGAGIHLEAAYGRTHWQADLDQGGEADVEVNVLETNAALLFSQRVSRTDIFAGPMVGAFGMLKDIEVTGASESRQSGTVYPGVMGGLRFRLAGDVHLELSDRISYHYLTVDDQREGSWVNEVSATVFFRPEAFRMRLFGDQ